MRKAVREWGSEYAVMEKSETLSSPPDAALVGGVVLARSPGRIPWRRVSPKQSIETTRHTAFWEARLKGDEATAYQYEIYAHSGEMTLTQYIRARSPMH